MWKELITENICIILLILSCCYSRIYLVYWLVLSPSSQLIGWQNVGHFKSHYLSEEVPSLSAMWSTCQHQTTKQTVAINGGRDFWSCHFKRGCQVDAVGSLDKVDHSTANITLCVVHKIHMHSSRNMDTSTCITWILLPLPILNLRHSELVPDKETTNSNYFRVAF